MPLRVSPADPAPRSLFTAAERRVLDACRTPRQVQAWLNALRYNTEVDRETQLSFRGVVSGGQAHCMEAALSAAVILEQHGYPPLVMSLESIDRLDHVIYVYKAPSGWGSIARSRDPGLHGRQPRFRGPRQLALSYVEPYVDFTGRVLAYGLADLRTLMGTYDWRLSARNLWAVEQALIDLPHRPLRTADARIDRLRRKYIAYRETHDDRKPIYYDRRRWTPIPEVFLDGKPATRSGQK